ncbi:MAG: histidine kinase [Bacteroidota bacterium]
MKSWRYALPLLTIFGLQACSQDAPISESQHVAIHDLLEDLSVWPACEGAHIDSVLMDLLPILLSPPEHQTVEDWFTDTVNWRAGFLDESDLFFHIDIIHNRLVEINAFGLAARVKNAKGRIHTLIGEPAQAMKEQKKAMRLAHLQQDSLMLAWVTFYLGTNSTSSGDYENGQQYLKEAMEMGISLGNPAIQALSEMYTGVKGMLEGKIDSIDVNLERIEHALNVTRTHNLPALAEVAGMNYAYAQLLSGDIDGAIDFMLMAAADIETVNRRNTYMYLNLCEAFLAKQAYEEAGKYLALGCEMAEKAHFAAGKLYCLRFGVDVAEGLGDFEEAYRLHLLYLEEQERQTGKKVSREIEYLSQQIELQQKETELQRLADVQLSNDRNWSRQRNNYISLSAFILLLFASSLLVMRSRQRATRAQEELEISETKLQAIQSQIHPKFILKVLRGIQSCTLNSDKIESYNYLGTFASILRIIARNSTEVAVSLDDEIALIRSYLEVERFSLSNKFTYEIDIDSQLLEENLSIPSMFLQPILGFIIDNGFANLSYTPHLNLKAKPVDDGILFVITHDGSGEKTTCEYLGKTSLLLKDDTSFIYSRRLEFFKEMGWESMYCKAETIVENGQQLGGKVVLFMPVVDSENLRKNLQLVESLGENKLSYV